MEWKAVGLRANGSSIQRALVVVHRRRCAFFASGRSAWFAICAGQQQRFSQHLSAANLRFSWRGHGGAADPFHVAWLFANGVDAQRRAHKFGRGLRTIFVGEARDMVARWWPPRIQEQHA